MSILNTVRGAMDTHLAGMAGVPTIVPQNVNFTPTAGVAYLKSTLVPTMIRPATRGLNPQLRYDGVYSVLICMPEGNGSGAGYDLADDILARFASTSDISFGSLIVSINYSEVDNSFLDTPFYCTPVNVAWYIYHS